MLVSVLADTSFLLALLDAKAPQHAVAEGYFNYFIEQDTRLYVSSISIAELGGVHPLEQLPIFPYFRLLPFNHGDAQLAANYAHTLREASRKNKKEQLATSVRDDVKLLAQAMTNEVAAFIADEGSLADGIFDKVFGGKPPFRVLGLHVPHEAAFGLTGKLF